MSTGTVQRGWVRGWRSRIIDVFWTWYLGGCSGEDVAGARIWRRSYCYVSVIVIVMLVFYRKFAVSGIDGVVRSMTVGDVNSLPVGSKITWVL